MDFRDKLSTRAISLAILFFFCWSFSGGVDIAWAIKNSDKLETASSGLKNQKTNASQQPKKQGSEEKFQKAIEAIERILADTVTDTDTKKNKLKGKKSEIESFDIEIKKQFAETGKKLKNEGLPFEILDRHYKFVKHYEDNLKELKGNLDAIDKGKDKAETDSAISKAKAHLEKVKPPKKHVPLDPNKLPHRLEEPIEPAQLESRMETQSILSKAISRIYGKAKDFLFPSAYAVEISSEERAANLAETIETPLSPEIVDFANELGDVPVDIFVPVRDGFKYEPYAGSVKGAVQTLKEKVGNEWDLASLLIALLRAKGIPARYVVGTIQMPIDQAMEWLGVEDPNMAATLLASNGRPTSLITGGGKINAIKTRHVWVQAFIPFTPSRGTTSGQGDRWVDIDPSYKPQKITQIQNLTGTPLFDQTEYLSTFRTISPYEYYESQLQAFLDVNTPGFKPNALMRETEIIHEISEVIVGQLPYVVQSVSGTYSEVPDSFRQKFTLTISDPDSGDVQFNYKAFLPQIIGKRLTLSYIPATASDQAVIDTYGSIYSTPSYLVYLKPVIKLDGANVAEGIPVQTGMMQNLVFLFDSTIDVGRVENIVVAGEYYAIGLNAQTSGIREQILDRIEKIKDLQETINLNDWATLDDRLGEILYLSAMVYHQNYDTEIRKISSLQKVVDIRKVSEMMYFLNVKVDTFFDVPIKITPAGITADMDRDIHLVIPVDGDVSRIKPYMQLVGNLSSYLEHAVTEGVYQTEAISAVKAIQLAHDQGIPVHTITSQNINIELPLLQINEQVKTDIINAVNAEKEVIVPEKNVTLHDWSGVGYVIQDPSSGNGAYMISRGLGGSTFVMAIGIIDQEVTPMSVFASQANQRTIKWQICYPAADNMLFSQDDTCYMVVEFGDIQEDCGEKGCKSKYGENHSTFAQPLIDFYEHSPETLLSKNITAWQWQSQDNARYMRAGRSVVLSVETLMAAFGVTKHNIRTNNPNECGSGYRSQDRNLSLPKSSGRSDNSFHVDGVAADIKLTNESGVMVRKCDVLEAADLLIGGAGQVAAEDKAGKKKETVHIAIMASRWRDRDKGFWGCR